MCVLIAPDVIKPETTFATRFEQYWQQQSQDTFDNITLDLVANESERDRAFLQMVTAIQKSDVKP